MDTSPPQSIFPVDAVSTELMVSNRSLSRAPFDGATFVRALPNLKFSEAALLTNAVINAVREVRGANGVVATSELARITDRIRDGATLDEAQRLVDTREFLTSPQETRGPLAPLTTMLGSFAEGLAINDPAAADAVRGLAGVLAYSLSQATLQELPRYEEDFNERLVQAGGKPSFNVDPEYVTYEKPSDSLIAKVKGFFETRKIDESMINEFLRGYGEDGGINYGEIPLLPEGKAHVHVAGLERLDPLEVGGLTQYPFYCHEAYAATASSDDIRAQAVPLDFPQRASIHPCPGVIDNVFVPNVDDPSRIAESPREDIPPGFFAVAKAGAHLYTHRHIVVVDPAFKGTFVEDLVALARKKLEDEREELGEKARAIVATAVTGLQLGTIGAGGLASGGAKVMLEAMVQIVLDELGGVAAPMPQLTVLSLRPLNRAPVVLASVLLIEPGTDGAIKRLDLNDLNVDGEEFSATQRASSVLPSTSLWVGSTGPTPKIGRALREDLFKSIKTEDDGKLAKLLKENSSLVWVQDQVGLGEAEKAALQSSGVAIGDIDSVASASRGLHILVKLTLPRTLLADGCYFVFYRIDTRLVPLSFIRTGVPVASPPEGG